MEERVRRCYDEIGWIDKLRLGVLLPDTPTEGASKLGQDICSDLIPNVLNPKHTIYDYSS